MTVLTRRRIIVCLVVLGLTLPVETILLQALSTPDSTEATAQWVASLSSEELDAAAGQIQSYPFAYRREIMRALSPERRADVWRAHLKTYIEQHPELDDSARQLLDSALALMTPETFASASAEIRSRTAAIGEQLVAVVGRDAAHELLYRLGPPDGTFASLEPLHLRLANVVRGVMVAMAVESDCNCASGWGCNETAACSTSTSCAPDEDWPMCGWLWNETCDGLCKIRDVN